MNLTRMIPFAALTNAETPTSLAASADQQTLQLPVSRLKMKKNSTNSDQYQFSCGISKMFGQELGNFFKKLLRGMSVHQNWA